MDWLMTLAGETRSRLLRLVRGATRSLNELADALGITDNAVRTHVPRSSATGWCNRRAPTAAREESLRDSMS